MDLFTLSASLGLDITGFQTGIGTARRLLLDFADAVVDFGKDVIDTGMGFDKQMSAVQAVLGSAEGTMENMERLREFALDQARDSVFTSEETAKAYYYMGMAGWKTEQMLSGLSGVMALAASSGEDLAKVSDIVTDSLTAFGLTADDTNHFVDVLAQTATNTNTDVARMGQVFRYVAPIAGQLGASVDDVALSIGLMANQGIKGSMAGTALRNIFTRLSTNAGATSKTLGALDILTEELGVQFWDAAGKMRDWRDIIVESRAAWQGLTQEQQVYYAKQIGSQRGMAAWLALMNATEVEINKVSKAIDESTGAAQNMADVRLDNLWGDVKLFNSSLDVLKIALYDDVKSPLRGIVQYGASALDRIRDSVLQDGLVGGLHQLGVEIHDFGETYSDELHELGNAIGEVLNIAITEIAPKLTDAAILLGGGFAAGLVKGIGENLPEGIANLLGFKIGEYAPEPDSEIYQRSLLGPEPAKAVETALYGGIEIPVDLLAQVDPEQLHDNIQAAINNGTDLEITDGYIVDTDTASQIAADIEAGMYNGDQAAASSLESTLSAVGPTVGSNISNDISTQLSAGNYSINVMANLLGLSGGFGPWRTEKFAKGMSGGYIMRGATVFGENSKGQPMVGGGEGPEAVVGTGSLNRMIQDSVGSAINSVLSRLDTMVDRVANYAPKIYLDTGALVGGTVNGMNSELNNVARWKGYGRV